MFAVYGAGHCLQTNGFQNQNFHLHKNNRFPRSAVRVRLLSTPFLLKSHNLENCVHITPSCLNNTRKGSETTFVPGLPPFNVMSLAPMIDEVRHFLDYPNVDLICLTETWLREHIHDSVVSVISINLMLRI